MQKLAFILCFFSYLYAAPEPQTRKHCVGIFCSAEDTIPDRYKEQVYQLGILLAEANCELATGGANTGLMNAIMNGFSAIKTNAPQIELKGIRHPHIARKNLVWTDTAHQRLQTFQQACDTLVILPGGFGTLHDLMNLLVSQQFEPTHKKIILFNADRFWDHLLLQFQTMASQNMLKEHQLDLLTVASSAEECVQMILEEETPSQHPGIKNRTSEFKQGRP